MSEVAPRCLCTYVIGDVGGAGGGAGFCQISIHIFQAEQSPSGSYLLLLVSVILRLSLPTSNSLHPVRPCFDILASSLVHVLCRWLVRFPNRLSERCCFGILTNFD